MLEQLIKNYLITSAKVDPAKFDQSGLMVADLGLDSLAMVEMLFEIEDRFGFQLSDPMRYQSMGYADMVTAIEAEVRVHHDGELPRIDAQGSAVHPR
ncbi:MAG: acyl carrier protein [Thiomonas sp. 20-64-5]|nr:MAG: acyl carrier protein [Thiomonas sp. 20-64-5]